MTPLCRPIPILHGNAVKWKDERLKWRDMQSTAATFADVDLKDDKRTGGYGPRNEHAVQTFVRKIVSDIFQIRGVRWFMDAWSSAISDGTLLYVTDEELLWLREALKTVPPSAFTNESDAAVWDSKRDGIQEEIRWAIEENVWRLRKHKENSSR